MANNNKRKGKGKGGKGAHGKGGAKGPNEPAPTGSGPANKPQEKKKQPTIGRKQRAAAARKAARRREMMNRLYWSLAGVFVVALLAFVFITGNETGSDEVDAWDLPAMGPTAQQQERVRLADFDGKPTVVNFFASWCTACDFELPFFVALSEEFDEEINWVGIASQETGDPMFMPNKHGATAWTLARDINHNGLSAVLGSPRGMPLTAFYDETGRLVDVVRGAVPSEQDLRSRLARYFGIQRVEAIAPNA